MKNLLYLTLVLIIGGLGYLKWQSKTKSVEIWMRCIPRSRQSSAIFSVPTTFTR